MQRPDFTKDGGAVNVASRKRPMRPTFILDGYKYVVSVVSPAKLVTRSEYENKSKLVGEESVPPRPYILYKDKESTAEAPSTDINTFYYKIVELKSMKYDPATKVLTIHRK
ncbi:unnamed protein product [Orchesella dallaii]|uniref:Uncharacterized protein n=1 Tax=Orchesella dallaii TaxID=48710 RepID=A0ABP1QPV2_9HEXA